MKSASDWECRVRAEFMLAHTYVFGWRAQRSSLRVTADQTTKVGFVEGLLAVEAGKKRLFTELASIVPRQKLTSRALT